MPTSHFWLGESVQLEVIKGLALNRLPIDAGRVGFKLTFTAEIPDALIAILDSIFDGLCFICRNKVPPKGCRVCCTCMAVERQRHLDAPNCHECPSPDRGRDE